MALTKISTDTIADSAITAVKIADGTVVAADIADNAVTLAKMAGGTDGQIITYDASGDPVAIGPGTAGQVLTSAGANLPQTFATAGGGAWNYLDSITASGQASINFENVFDSTYDQYRITGTTIIPSVDGIRFEWQAGTSSTPTYVTTGYQYHYCNVYSGANIYYGTSSTSSTIGVLTRYVGADTGQVLYFEHNIFKPSDTTKYKCFSGSLTAYGEFNHARLGTHVSTLPSTTAVTSLKYFCENGNFVSGIFRLYGLANS